MSNVQRGHGPPGAPGGAHLDDLTAMRLADGEAVRPEAQFHAAGCDVCCRLVAGFRLEARAFLDAFALDPAELAALGAARLPERFAALAGVATADALAAPAVPQRESTASLAAILAVATGGYAGWWVLTNAAAPYVHAAQDLGIDSIALQLAGTLAIRFVLLVWQVASAAAAQPWVQAPALPTLLMALLTLVLFWTAPRFAPRRLEAV